MRVQSKSDLEVVSQVKPRMVRGLAALGCCAAVTATSLGVIATSDDGRSGAGLVASGRNLPSDEVLKYWADSKAALPPLLLYVRQLPLSIQAVRDTKGEASDSQLRQAKVMADSFATARDLVGRIAVPASAPAGVGELLQVACQLYRQSALTLRELRTARDAAARVEVGTRAAGLQAVGDRLFDQVRRVLAIDVIGQDQAPAEFRYAPPVPAVTDLPGTVPPAAAGPVDLDLALSAARSILEQESTGSLDVTAASRRALASIAHTLELESVGQGEDVIGARLAIALALIAQSAEADGQAKSAGSILMISNDVWNQARTLSEKPHPALEVLGAPMVKRSQVWTGGQFDGSPPALAPGQDVGSGVPGGLPEIDPTQILKG